jgi:hypothetical protein
MKTPKAMMQRNLKLNLPSEIGENGSTLFSIFHSTHHDNAQLASQLITEI